MANPNRIPHDVPELKDVLLGFLESASSLCYIMNTTMAASEPSEETMSTSS